MDHLHIKRYDLNNTAGISVSSYVREGKISLHGHDFYEFEYIGAGAGCHVLNDRGYEMTPGMIVCLSPDDYHRYDTDEMDVRNLIVVPEATAEPICSLLSGQSFPRYGVIPPEHRAQIEELFDRIGENYRKPSAFRDTKILAYTLALLSEYLTFSVCCDKNTVTWKSYSHVQKALQYIDAHFSEPLTLQDISDAVNISGAHLSSIFPSFVGCHYTEYLTQVRLKEARYLLRESQLSILEIAYKTGFGHISTMNRAFNRYFHISPSAYRKQNR